VYTPDIEAAVIEKGNEQLAPYGVAITRMGNFDINLAPDDQAQLKKLAKDTSYSRLAGSFNQYAAGEMALGAGEGMAQGGGAVSGAFLGMGLGMAGVAGGQPTTPTAPPAAGFAGGGPGGYAGPPPGGAAPTATAPATVACPTCGVMNPEGAKFCMGCGGALAPQTRHCTNCGTELAPGAKFCGSCGTPAP
jgi:membrane protease subunit (stomatin/prohibitin family)